MAEREVIHFPFWAQLRAAPLFPAQSRIYTVRLFPTDLASHCVSQMNVAERFRELSARNGEIR
jgi:hypothetical protein